MVFPVPGGPCTSVRLWEPAARSAARCVSFSPSSTRSLTCGSGGEPGARNLLEDTVPF